MVNTTISESRHSTPAEQMERQLQTYLAEPLISNKSDPFGWLADNAKRLPELACVARKFLAIPATSVASERVFSAAGVWFATDEVH